ncbi:pyridoxamine 5'-phosphate oxidase family protein [Mycobacterium sp. 21AC1]|uniref:pyridoxamine 5'-phosphate oxidase family protein n=1 Tax=[Mycobacterium] appelbergii TaxID=2939269 RepID=UPI0029390B7E|nr:pyridoxamine 5'-phosphate oxidase family protein [Mycobacterium sp. 21AC1]MDV3125641.1 pyridoxamine 5'-phosphate oxidase family protein [Mycobacterium sp. 21AC1]
MSVKVDLDQLADALGDYAFAYLVTVGDDYHAHTVVVDPVFADGVLDVGTIGGHTRRNVAQHSDVTLLWPPREADGYTLIVDGVGEVPVTEDRSMRIVPRRAVLHRRAAPDSPATAAGCLHDCVPIEED